MYGHHFGLAATHWKDERDVFIFTTCKREGEAVVSRCGERVRIANVFHTYNLFLVGALRWQHHILQKKRVKKWYKKQFMHLIISSQFCLIMCISNLNALLLKKKWGKRRCFVIQNENDLRVYVLLRFDWVKNAHLLPIYSDGMLNRELTNLKLTNFINHWRQLLKSSTETCILL